MKEKEARIENRYEDVTITKADNGFVINYLEEIFSEFDDVCYVKQTVVFEQKEEKDTRVVADRNVNAFKEMVYHLAEHFGIVNTSLSDLFKLEE